MSKTISPERQKEMERENMAASVRIMGRAMAPTIFNLFTQAALATGKAPNKFYLVLRFKPGSDVNDVKSVMIELRESDQHTQIELRDKNPGENNNDISDQTSAAFPLLKATVDDYVEQWCVSHYDLFLLLKIGKQEETGADALQAYIQTRKGLGFSKQEKII
jgi:phage terminase large subunit-like protein